MAPGQSFNAREIGIAERTPCSRASYDAEHTTPRLPGAPPTISNDARPAPSGSTCRATATKNASASARRMRRGSGSCSVGGIETRSNREPAIGSRVIRVKLALVDQGRHAASTSNAALFVTRTTSEPSAAIV